MPEDRIVDRNMFYNLEMSFLHSSLLLFLVRCLLASILDSENKLLVDVKMGRNETLLFTKVVVFLEYYACFCRVKDSFEL